tara:strand:+ start:217 stop:729 length:513 start_codon:yes stop_codon:yes gene_type:complete
MKLKKNLVLLGMMGSGKSTIGRLLAKKLNLRFVDIDNYIEFISKMKIAEFFKKKGENSFRKLEQKVTLKFLKKIGYVISLGGGGFVNEKIRKEVKKNAIDIWLNCSSEILIKRIRKNNKRPLVAKMNDIELENLIISRSKIYSKSKYRVNCKNMSKFKIVNKIVRIYENN